MSRSTSSGDTSSSVGDSSSGSGSESTTLTSSSASVGTTATADSLRSLASILDVAQPDEDDHISKSEQIAANLKDEIDTLAAIRSGNTWKAKCIFYIKSLSGLLTFLIFINAIGFILWTANANAAIGGSEFIYWCLLIDIAVVAFFALRIVLSIFLLIVYAIPPVRIVYHILNPFEDLLVLIGTVVGAWVAHSHILIDIESSAGDRIAKLFQALIAACVFFLVKRAGVLLIEVLALREAQSDMSAARYWNKVMQQVYQPKKQILVRYEKLSPERSFGWARHSWLQFIKLPSVASHLRADGLDVLAGYKVNPSILASAGALARLTDEIGNNLYSYIEDRNAGGVTMTSILDRYPGHFGRLLFLTFGGEDERTIIDKDTVIARLDVAIKQRNCLLNTLNGRLLLKYVADSILRVILGFVVLFLVLGAFDIDLLVLMLPFASFALALSFSFARLVSDFVISLHMIFFVQPYDLGDLVVIDGNGPYRVLSVSVMTTTFQSLSGFRVTMPNAQIATSRLENHRKSSSVVYTIDHLLKSSLSLGDVAEIKGEFAAWLAERSQVYSEDTNMFVIESKTDEAVLLRTVLTVKASWQDRGIWLGAATGARLAMNEILENAGVQFGNDYKIKQE